MSVIINNTGTFNNIKASSIPEFQLNFKQESHYKKPTFDIENLPKFNKENPLISEIEQGIALENFTDSVRIQFENTGFQPKLGKAIGVPGKTNTIGENNFSSSFTYNKYNSPSNVSMKSDSTRTSHGSYVSGLNRPISPYSFDHARFVYDIDDEKPPKNTASKNTASKNTASKNKSKSGTSKKSAYYRSYVNPSVFGQYGDMKQGSQGSSPLSFIDTPSPTTPTQKPTPKTPSPTTPSPTTPTQKPTITIPNSNKKDKGKTPEFVGSIISLPKTDDSGGEKRLKVVADVVTPPNVQRTKLFVQRDKELKEKRKKNRDKRIAVKNEKEKKLN
jgi:hypothetical protein